MCTALRATRQAAVPSRRLMSSAAMRSARCACRCVWVPMTGSAARSRSIRTCGSCCCVRRPGPPVPSCPAGRCPRQPLDVHGTLRNSPRLVGMSQHPGHVILPCPQLTGLRRRLWHCLWRSTLRVCCSSPTAPAAARGPASASSRGSSERSLSNSAASTAAAMDTAQSYAAAAAAVEDAAHSFAASQVPCIAVSDPGRHRVRQLLRLSHRLQHCNDAGNRAALIERSSSAR